jgi:hypothetical protein
VHGTGVTKPLLSHDIYHPSARLGFGWPTQLGLQLVKAGAGGNARRGDD